MRFVITFGFRINSESQENHSVIDNEVTIKRTQKMHKTKKVETTSDTLVNADAAKNIINATRLITDLRIEYEAIPLYRFTCDCKIWDNVTEVSDDRKTRYLRHLSSPNDETVRWSVFSVHHSTNLNENQLKRFFNHKINFHVSPGRGTSSKSKNSEVKQFEIRDENEFIEDDAFLEIYPIDSKQSGKESVPGPITVKDNQDGDFAIVSYIDPIPDIVHTHKFRNMMKNGNVPSHMISIGLENTDEETKPTVKKSGKALRSKSERTKPKIKVQSCEIVVPVESLFSAMGILTRYNSLPEISDISHLLLYIQCEDVLPTRALQIAFNPISLNLEKLLNFPHSILMDSGFLYVYVRTVFVDRVIKSPYYSINECIYLEYVKTFLYEEFQPEQLINFLAAKVLIVEVIGIRDTSTRESKTDNLDSLNKSVSKEEVLLGVAIFDLSELLRGIWEVKLTNSLVHPSVVYPANISDASNTASEEKSPISWGGSLFTYETLALLGTSMQLRIRVGADLRPIHKRILRSPGIFNRIFLTLQNVGFAEKLVEDVCVHNVTMRQCTDYLNDTGEFYPDVISEDYITGFAIDCTDKYYVLLEGLSKGYLLAIWESLMELPAEIGYVYYNSECFFLTRLYEKFLSSNGILKIQMRETLEKQLREQNLYIGKRAKTAQSEILRKLGLIQLTSTMRSLCQSHVLPDTDQLLAF